MRIITGLQPSGKLHIGNYFGAMEPAVRMQDRGESYYFLADYHAMSTVHDADILRPRRIGTCLLYTSPSPRD